jgi:NDP-sugar pyrophosphorylase family protein
MLKQAVILAGGKGTRLMPLTKDIPKPMVKVASQPFLYWQLKYLQEQGVRNVLLLVSHLGGVIQEHFTKHPISGLSVAFAFEPEPLGTGGALRLALGNLDEKFWLLNGDSFLHADLAGMHAHIGKHPWPACIAALTDSQLVPVPGNIKMQDGLVTEFRKGAGRENGFPCVDAGVYMLTRQLIEGGREGRFDLETYWPELIAKRMLGAFPVTERFYDIGTPERLKEFEEHVHDYF